MKRFCCPTFIALLLLLLVHPLAIYMQFNNYNGFYPGNYPQNGYYPYYYGNGNGFCYVNTPYCCYNYIPPNFLYLLGPLISQILRSLTLPNLGSLLNSLQTTSPLTPGFFNGLQSSNPPIYNAYNQLNNAYNGLDPATQQIFQQFLASMFPALQNAIGTFNSQPTPQFDQNFPQLANFLRSQGMRQFARDPSPFGPSSQSPNQLPPQQPNNPLQPVPSVVNSGSNTGQPAQQPINGGGVPGLGQPAQQPINGGGVPDLGQSAQQPITGGGGVPRPGLVDGILGAVGSVASSALQQGRK